jgi:hypothetical protein
MSMRRLAQTLCCAIACLLSAAGRADSIDPETNTDGFNPAASAHQMGEARRLDLIARQLDLNYRMIRSAGYGPQYPNPFEPWPRVPGDIWGYPRSRPIEHPIGHESGQIAPDRWIYRPLYAADLNAAPPAVPAPASPRAPGFVEQLPGPSDPEPEKLAPAARPKKKSPGGPREF